MQNLHTFNIFKLMKLITYIPVSISKVNTEVDITFSMFPESSIIQILHMV